MDPFKFILQLLALPSLTLCDQIALPPAQLCDLREGTSLLQHRATPKLAPVHAEEKRDSIAADGDCSEAVQVIPQPQNIHFRKTDALKLLRDSKLSIESPLKLLDHVVERYFLNKVGLEASSEAPDFYLRLRLSPTLPSNLRKEGYALDVSATGIEITALTEHGLFNGIMTLSQLPQRCRGSWILPAVHISDVPAMSWRGLMLDVSRHFFPAENITRLLDTMAMFKFNRFHWHITDDQGWRIDIPGLPALTQKGAWRAGTQIGHGSDVDHRPYGGFYTQDEVQRVVQHAQNLFIEVIPEIDMPGHVQAAIAAYPELGNIDIPGWKRPEVAKTWGPHEYTLSPKKESFQFAKTVLTEVFRMIPSRFVHIGGDEVSNVQWQASKTAKASASFLQGQSPSELFATMLAEHVLDQKKTPIVWDEALDSDLLPKDATIMVWRPDPDPRGIAKKALHFGHNVILAPQWYTYFDHPQATGEIGRPHDSIGGDTLTLRKVYEFPLEDFGWSHNSSILGGQGQLWTEYLQTLRDVEYMAWPRGIALAEVLWSADQRPGFVDFRQRLDRLLSEWKRDPHAPTFRQLKPADRDDSPKALLDQLGRSLGKQVLKAHGSYTTT